ncbi:MULTISPECIES: translesion DNA synthesis-associated protein ImuA [Burkholderiaceae]|uniref:translesion DNA synthesis-associated protein ImuA n=1 Tax=Burkholderiaceae TaxID=119060 RepID=UPI000E2582AE|nr:MULTISPECIES: translesion DNA synthesis-associated protein ImuA [Burkholderiaceae]MDN8037053.1 translesion DNA synthesis-associated protein ImuA [Burkholderia vietnamiensis]REE17744.1 cell division inhibitor SulA/protein ImuA [Paraburkholderia sp. BL27I4N3]
MAALPQHVESIHPALWRGAQLARAHGRTVDTGYAALSAELPGGGWPLGALVELLVQQPGIGEMRLLKPALTEMSTRPIVLLQPPHVPNSLAFSYLGLPIDRLMRLRAPKTADALWCAERVLQAKSCGALILWQQHIRTEALRRLHLAAQASETMLVLIRPLASAQDASPATLRLAVRPANGGLVVDVVKRRGPTRTETLSITLQPSPITLSPYGRVRRHLPAPAFAGGVPSEVVTSD